MLSVRRRKRIKRNESVAREIGLLGQSSAASRLQRACRRGKHSYEFVSMGQEMCAICGKRRSVVVV